MATNTTNYNLTKPDLEDFADIRVLNNNLDIIDTKMKEIEVAAGSGIDLAPYALKSEIASKYLPLLGGNLTGPLTINNQEVLSATSTNIGDYTGYIKLSNNLVVQWGYADLKGENERMHITFGQPMPNTNYALFLTRSNLTLTTPPVADGDLRSHASFNCTTTGFDLMSDHFGQGKVMFWLAIGWEA